MHSIAYNYPAHIEPSNNEHQKKKKYTKQLFENLQHTLPCKYCRESFKVFLKELPIDASLGSRKQIVSWLYDIHNKVNDKLRRQELEAAEAAKKDAEEEDKK